MGYTGWQCFVFPEPGQCYPQLCVPGSDMGSCNLFFNIFCSSLRTALVLEGLGAAWSDSAWSHMRWLSEQGWTREGLHGGTVPGPHRAGLCPPWLNVWCYCRPWTAVGRTQADRGGCGLSCVCLRHGGLDVGQQETTSIAIYTAAIDDTI